MENTVLSLFVPISSMQIIDNLAKIPYNSSKLNLPWEWRGFHEKNFINLDIPIIDSTDGIGSSWKAG